MQLTKKMQVSRINPIV